MRRNALSLLWISLAAIVLTGCAADPLSELTTRRVSSLSLPLSGVYDITAQAPFSGSLTTRLYAEPTERGFEARTREGVAWPMIGGMARLLGPVVAPTLFPRGVILEWTSGLPSDAGPGEGWIGVAGLPSLGARTLIHSADEPVEIIGRDGRRAGLIRVAPVRPGDVPDTDYHRLAVEIERVMEREVYDQAAVRTNSVAAYGSRLREVARFARDDAEFVFGAVLAGRAHLRFSLPILWRDPWADFDARFAAWSDAERSTVRAWFDRWKLPALLRVDAFFETDDVEAAMREIADRAPQGLAIDLRSSPGVTLSSLLVLRALVEEPVDAGVFFGGRRRAEVLAGDTGAVPTVRVTGASSIEELESVLERDGAARVIIEPAEATFRGPVCVLTSKKTSTSAEPLVWMLQHTGRAGVIGQTTAGRPVISHPVSVGQGWTLWLAAYDYMPPTGVEDRFNGRGVRPDVATRDAVGEARRWFDENR